MNVTGIEWRDLDPHESKFPEGSKHRRAHKHPEEDPADEDIVQIHGQADEETADGLDSLD